MKKRAAFVEHRSADLNEKERIHSNVVKEVKCLVACSLGKQQLVTACTGNLCALSVKAGGGL